MKKIFLISFHILLLFSCNNDKVNNAPITENAVDNAEPSVAGSLSKSGYRGEANMVYQIYDELMKNDKKLQGLNERINAVNNETSKVTSEYEKIIGKSTNYYSDAKDLTKSITDSLMKKEMVKEIQNSSDQYKLKTKNINDLINQININITNLNNQYIVFKIQKTLSEIEKYQSAHPLKTDNLNNFIYKQRKLIEELKNLK